VGQRAKEKPMKTMYAITHVNKFMLVATHHGYDYYQDGEKYYNIVPHGSMAPISGYKDKAYILRIKHVEDKFEEASI
jgi:hypothetical protein